MRYIISFKPLAIKDLADFPKQEQVRILRKVEQLADGLAGDVKRLTNFTPEYRLRVGNYRVLFEVEQDRIVIYRVKHRREAYE
jgi:mRNA interferase RelE/StbE